MNRIPLESFSLTAVMLALAGCAAPPNPQAAGRPTASSGVVVACSGRVEGRSETVEVGAGVTGVITAIHVKEGQAVTKGAPLAEIDCQDMAAALQAAGSEAESARQVRNRVLRGSREEERQMAAQKTAAARAELERARLNLERTEALYRQDEVPRSTLDDARRDHEVAQANLKEAIRREELVNAPPLPEEVAKADADIAAAENKARMIREQMAKCTVTAPMNGTILRVLTRPGESFSVYAPRPILMMADISVRRVRAEIDETDVMSVRPGQKALVFSDAQQERKYTGVVEHIATSVGRKKILSGDPSEKTDHDVLEALIKLGPEAQTLPVGMRVVVQFQR